jgi:hypothetical protein
MKESTTLLNKKLSTQQSFGLAIFASGLVTLLADLAHSF